MLSKYALAARSRLSLGTALVAAFALSLAVAGAASAASPPVGSFQKRASSPKPVNNVAVDPTTNMIYAQQYEGKGFYRYNPRTNKWTTLHLAPIKQGNNGGAAYVKGKIYTVYTNNDTQMGVYDIATGTWSTITNPLGAGTGDITSHMGLLYLVEGTDFVSYDPATDTTQTLASPPFSFTDYGGLAPYKGKIYGQEGNGDTGFAQYDIASDTWNTDENLPSGGVLGAAIDPVTGIFYAYGNYEDDLFYRYSTAQHHWLFTLQFPFHNLNDGGMAYVSAKGLQGIYATYGQGNNGFTRYVTPPR
ncbi:MAG TPA: hypothetical protein VGL78_04105 [Solirubrobacteraceae bacterium]|jgi:hypothetical protein